MGETSPTFRLYQTPLSAGLWVIYGVTAGPGNLIAAKAEDAVTVQLPQKFPVSNPGFPGSRFLSKPDIAF